MSCVRGCSGTPLCSALNLCCIQFRQDCGKECDGVADGYSTIQVNAAGELVVCSNVGGVCTCASPATDTDVLVNNLDGTATHTAVDGTVVVLDICQMVADGGCSDALVDNADGTATHTDLDGNPVTLDICQMIQDGACSDALVDNADGTATHTAVNGTVVVLDICQMIQDGACSDAVLVAGATIAHTAVDGTLVQWNVCTLVQNNCDDTLVLNGLGGFTHTSVGGVAVVVDICTLIAEGTCTDILVDNLNGTATHTALDGTIVILDICQMIIDGNCFAQTSAFDPVNITGLPGVIAPGAAWTVVAEAPATITLNNPSTSPMTCAVEVQALQVNARNTDAVNPATLDVEYQWSTDGGGTWASSAPTGIRAIMDVAGSVHEFVEQTTGNLTFPVVIPAGGTQTYHIRRRYRSLTGFTGVASVDSQLLSATCTAVPV